MTETSDELFDALQEAFEDNDPGRFAEIDRRLQKLGAEERAQRGLGLKAQLERRGIIGCTPSLVPILRIEKVQCGLEGEVAVVGVANRISPRDENEPVYVARRGGRLIKPPTKKLHLFLRDDTDEILCIVDRFAFAKFGLPVIDRGRAKKALYAVEGTVPATFRMIKVTDLRYAGDMDQEYKDAEARSQLFFFARNTDV